MSENAGSFLFRWWRVFIETIRAWFGGKSDMGVGVKIALGVISGVSTQNLTVPVNGVTLINPDVSLAVEPVTVAVLLASNVPVEYEYKG